MYAVVGMCRPGDNLGRGLSFQHVGSEAWFRVPLPPERPCQSGKYFRVCTESCSVDVSYDRSEEMCCLLTDFIVL